MSDCLHGMESDWCGLCNKPQLPEPNLDPVGPTIAARFTGGRCPAGNDTIYEGEDIVRTEDGWCHASCLE